MERLFLWPFAPADGPLQLCVSGSENGTEILWRGRVRGERHAKKAHLTKENAVKSSSPLPWRAPFGQQGHTADLHLTTKRILRDTI